MKNSLNFAFEYNKLDYGIFPTVRGASYYPFKSTFYCITVNYNYHCFAIMKDQCLVMIKDIPIELLVWDVAPFKISTHYQYMVFLNRFRKYNKLESTTAFVSLLFFEKLWDE